MQPRHEIPGGQNIIGDVAAIRRQIRRNAGCRQKLAKTGLAVLEIFAEGAQADSQRFLTKRQLLTMLLVELTSHQQLGRANHARGHFTGAAFENLKARVAADKSLRLRRRDDLNVAAWRFLKQQLRYASQFQHGPHRFGGFRYGKCPVDLFELFIGLEQYPDACGANVLHLFHIEPDRASSPAQHLGYFIAQMPGPISIEPTLGF